jgi:hypothetical protein
MNEFDIKLDRLLDLKIAYEAISFEVELLNLKGVKCESLKSDAEFKQQTIEKLENELRSIAPEGFNNSWFDALTDVARRRVM